MSNLIIKDFSGPGEHLYEDRLGWQDAERNEARSKVSKAIFEMEVVKTGLNMTFYYVDNDTYYGIHTEEVPIKVKILPRANEPYIEWQCQADTHEDGQVIAEFPRAKDIWDNLKIDGKSLEEVLERSVIMKLN